MLASANTLNGIFIMKLLPVVLLITALAATTSALAAANTRETFVNKAALDGMTEVELGKLASAKSKNPEIKKFGDRMVKDHGQANAELEALAKAKNVPLPKKLDAEHQSMVDNLRSKSGTEFDSTYAQHMASDHAEAITLFEDARNLGDREIASFAEKTLPTLREHKRMADRLNAH
jgi:putative membrane protein